MQWEMAGKHTKHMSQGTSTFRNRIDGSKGHLQVHFAAAALRGLPWCLLAALLDCSLTAFFELSISGLGAHASWFSSLNGVARSRQGRWQPGRRDFPAAAGRSWLKNLI